LGAISGAVGGGGAGAAVADVGAFAGWWGVAFVAVAGGCAGTSLPVAGTTGAGGLAGLRT
jgi:hypothetical protein